LLHVLGQSARGKKKKRTHDEVTPVENMVFNKPTIGKKKKGTCKPRATIFDPRPSYVAQKDLALQFQSLLLKCTPIAVGLHVMAEPEVEEAVNEVEHQERLEGNEDVSSNAQASQPELYSIENFLPLPGVSTLPQIKDACVAGKRKLSFSDEEIGIVEKKTRSQSNCADWYRFKRGRISASKCKRVASLKPSISATKTRKEVVGYSETPQTTAMREGLEKEDEIAQGFISEMAKKGCSGVSLEGCEFFYQQISWFFWSFSRQNYSFTQPE